MKSRFHEAADAVLTEGVAYYDGKVSGLGDRFLAEVKAATRYIEQYPQVALSLNRGSGAEFSSGSPTRSCTPSTKRNCSFWLWHTRAGVQRIGPIVCLRRALSNFRKTARRQEA